MAGNTKKKTNGGLWQIIQKGDLWRNMAGNTKKKTNGGLWQVIQKRRPMENYGR